ncbi:hypothetical protein [Hoeflea sp.]|uniref:hypothetical protein n=1 Tax=Hoeflea sp. TaxID=1940281 RepID=UPI0019919679|nr:hypothetical protein [Hoeflea sp.]MBC7283282.1 hypothetical protein [Hoeflea sp.]
MTNQDYELEQRDGGWAYVIDGQHSSIYGSREAAISAASGHTRPEPLNNTDNSQAADWSEDVNRPGFDLGGSDGDTDAGKGLGLGTDAEKNRKGWGLPR